MLLGSICPLGTPFRQNTLIATFREFRNFTGVNTLLAVFMQNSSIQYVTLPETVTTLSSGVFVSSSLRDLIIPESVTSIGTDCVRECAYLERVVIYGKVTNLATRIFYNTTRLKLLVLPETVTTLVNNDQFARTHSLETVICNAPSPPTLANTRLFTFAGSDKNYPVDHEQVIYVPDDSIGDYSTAQYWSSYASRLRTFSQLAADNPEFYENYVVDKE